MNFNTIIAVLVVKNIITREEGEALVEHLNHAPQSTMLRDTLTDISNIIGTTPPVSAVPHIGPVGPAQQAETIAAALAPVFTPVAETSPELTPTDEVKPSEVKKAEQEGGETFEPKNTIAKKDTDKTKKK